MANTTFLRRAKFFTLMLLVYITAVDVRPRWNESTETPVFVDHKPSLDIEDVIANRFLQSSYGPIDADLDKPGLDYDFYRESCPLAETIVREMVLAIHQARPRILPSLIRLSFHDCFIEGCDASLLLDRTDEMPSEKDATPNELLQGFDVIDAIKSEIERICPRTVSCADILVLTARESLTAVGGPYYPLQTGRRDSMMSYQELAEYQLPSPFSDISETLMAFSVRGFDDRETVSLLGAHSIGLIHCKFFEERLYNFSGTNGPDPSLDPEFLKYMRYKCSNKVTPTSAPEHSYAPSPTLGAANPPDPSVENPSFAMSYEDPGSRPGENPNFGASYYQNLLQRRGILFADQQLMASVETGSWVRAYAWDIALFRKDFAEAMLKMSTLQVLTAPYGQVRANCSRVG